MFPRFGRAAVIDGEVQQKKNVDLLKRRSAHAREKLAEAERKLQTAVTVLRRWRKKVDYYAKLLEHE